ncbi:MAG: hypothetical protein K6T63_14575 [Alicyclobacillus herbarius]|nr:hypothetical protein [Alicyclobacillus herbarius]MCL6633842.1 hypothetical protein [Alicyclobacillus herbarius]
MFLHKVPTVRVPKAVIYLAAIWLGTFYFWFTKPAQTPTTRTSRRNTEI